MPGSIRADAVVLVFARAPVPGRAKTRLAAKLGAWGAAQLQARLTARTLRVASGFPVQLHGTSRHAYFRALRVPFVLQKGRDLGARMDHAVARALRRHRAVIVIGTDCPVLRPRDLRRAARFLCTRDVVLMPAEDGGYALIGLRRARGELFHGIEWGGDAVCRQTVRRIEAAGLTWKAMRTVWDVDRPEDLERFRSLRFSSGARRGARR